MGAHELLLDLAARGIRLAVQDGRLVVTPASRLTDADRDAIRNCRGELLALLTQDQKPDPSGSEGASAAPAPSRGAPDPGVPSDWQTADRAYQSHAWRCPACSSAGRGCGSRCPEGARLWAAYTAQPGSASRRPERQPQDAHADPTPHPYAKERVRWWPADGREIERMAATFERARALGFAPEEADRLAEVAHWAARLGDARPCVCCGHFRAGANSRWWCAAQRQPLPLQFVTEPHRCERFAEAEPEGGSADGG